MIIIIFSSLLSGQNSDNRTVTTAAVRHSQGLNNKLVLKELAHINKCTCKKFSNTIDTLISKKNLSIHIEM